MKRFLPIVSLLLMVLMNNCTSQPDKATIEKYGMKADTIAQQSQKLLLQNLTKTIADSGLVAAIGYCNINADSLTNVNATQAEILSIQRLTDRNRNPNNALSEDMDKKVFARMKLGTKDTLIINEKEYTYYKPIKIAMPTCLSCHGSETEMNKEALAKINNLYPNDKAKGYQLEELRGMWKIKIKQQ